MAGEQELIDNLIPEWAPTGGSALANTQSLVNGLGAIIGFDLADSGQMRKPANPWVAA